MENKKLNQPIEVRGRVARNRVVFNPMESSDCGLDGSMSEYTRNKYMGFARSGAGVIWFEANSVCSEGRTSARQMMLTAENLDEYKKDIETLREEALKKHGFEPLFILQLTHSGRQSVHPMIAYRNELYEKTRPVSDDEIVSDEYLDGLVEKFVNSAVLAKKAGFDGVDIKTCHGYLLAELLSAFSRKGKYGGSFENRTRLYRDVVNAVNSVVGSDLLLTSRIGVSDCIPGGFSSDTDGKEDLSETKKLISLVKDKIDIFNVTLANPYYNSEVSRPCVADKNKGLYLDKFYENCSQLKKSFPETLFVNSALSCYRGEMISVAEKMLEDNVCDFAGFGRITLAYPEFYEDYLSGKFDEKKCCVTCSRCTRLLRNKIISGCAVFNPIYKEIYKENIK